MERACTFTCCPSDQDVLARIRAAPLVRSFIRRETIPSHSSFLQAMSVLIYFPLLPCERHQIENITTTLFIVSIFEQSYPRIIIIWVQLPYITREANLLFLGPLHSPENRNRFFLRESPSVLSWKGMFATILQSNLTFKANAQNDCGIFSMPSGTAEGSTRSHLQLSS